VDRADPPSDRGARVPEAGQLREEPPQVVEPRAGQIAPDAPKEGGELREVAAVGIDRRWCEVALERQVIREPIDQGDSQTEEGRGRA
jgi:hypothetical protein